MPTELPPFIQHAIESHRARRARGGDRKVLFLWHWGHHYHLFRLIGQALPDGLTSRRLGVYQLIPAPLPWPLRHGGPLPPEVMERIMRFEAARMACARHTPDSAQFAQWLSRVATEWYDTMRRHLEGYDAVVLWSAFRVPLSAAAAAAHSLGIHAIICENGPFPGTMAMDPGGINAESSITDRPAEAYRGLVMDPALREALLATRLRQRPLRKAHGAAHDALDDTKPLPERYVLFPMQVHDDSQVLVFSPRFDTVAEAVRYTAAQVEQHNARTGDRLALVVKEHPSDYGRIDYGPLRAALPQVRFVRTTPVSEIVGQARAVVTLNSSVGVEALLHMRPVATLGRALYNVPGVARHVGADEELGDVLPGLVDQPVDEDLVTKFLYFLRYEYLLPLTLKGATGANVLLAAQRVADVLAGRLSWARPTPEVRP